MARVLKGAHSFTCTPRVHLLTEWTIPAFAFPARAGTYLPSSFDSFSKRALCASKGPSKPYGIGWAEKILFAF